MTASNQQEKEIPNPKLRSGEAALGALMAVVSARLLEREVPDEAGSVLQHAIDYVVASATDPSIANELPSAREQLIQQLSVAGIEPPKICNKVADLFIEIAKSRDAKERFALEKQTQDILNAVDSSSQSSVDNSSDENSPVGYNEDVMSDSENENLSSRSDDSTLLEREDISESSEVFDHEETKTDIETPDGLASSLREQAKQEIDRTTDLIQNAADAAKSEGADSNEVQQAVSSATGDTQAAQQQLDNQLNSLVSASPVQPESAPGSSDSDLENAKKELLYRFDTFSPLFSALSLPELGSDLKKSVTEFGRLNAELKEKFSDETTSAYRELIQKRNEKNAEMNRLFVEAFQRLLDLPENIDLRNIIDSNESSARADFISLAYARLAFDTGKLKQPGGAIAVLLGGLYDRLHFQTVDQKKSSVAEPSPVFDDLPSPQIPLTETPINPLPSQMPWETPSAQPEIAADSHNRPFTTLLLSPLDRAMEAQDLMSRLEVHGDVFNGRELTATFLTEHGLSPERKISDGERTLWLSEKAYDLGEGRVAVMAYVESEGKIVPRSFYLSNSQGVWRYLPYYETVHDNVTGLDSLSHYGKGYGEESVTLPVSLQVALSEISLDKKDVLHFDDADRQFIFAGTAKNRFSERGRNITYVLETSEKPERLPGNFYYSGLDERGKVLPSQLSFSDERAKPDFSRKIAKWNQRSSVYGEITNEVYVSKDGKWQYIFCKAAKPDGGDRVWIGGVEDLASPMQSTGLRKQWVDPGDLGTPGIEYFEQTDGWGDADDVYFDNYQGMQSYLDRIPLIQEYKARFGIKSDDRSLSKNDDDGFSRENLPLGNSEDHESEKTLEDYRVDYVEKRKGLIAIGFKEGDIVDFHNVVNDYRRSDPSVVVTPEVFLKILQDAGYKTNKKNLTNDSLIRFLKMVESHDDYQDFLRGDFRRQLEDGVDRAVLAKAFLDESEALQRALIQESKWKERGKRVFDATLGWYGRQPKLARYAFGAAAVTGFAISFGGVGMAGAGGYFGYRLARAVTSGTITSLLFKANIRGYGLEKLINRIGAGNENYYAKKRTELEQSVALEQEDGTLPEFDKFFSYLGQIEQQNLKNIEEKKSKDFYSKVAKAGVTIVLSVAAGGATAYGFDELANQGYLNDFGIHPASNPVSHETTKPRVGVADSNEKLPGTGPQPSPAPLAPELQKSASALQEHLKSVGEKVSEVGHGRGASDAVFKQLQDLRGSNPQELAKVLRLDETQTKILLDGGTLSDRILKTEMMRLLQESKFIDSHGRTLLGISQPGVKIPLGVGSDGKLHIQSGSYQTYDFQRVHAGGGVAHHAVEETGATQAKNALRSSGADPSQPAKIETNVDSITRPRRVDSITRPRFANVDEGAIQAKNALNASENIGQSNNFIEQGPISPSLRESLKIPPTIPGSEAILERADALVPRDVLTHHLGFGETYAASTLNNFSHIKLNSFIETLKATPKLSDGTVRTGFDASFVTDRVGGSPYVVGIGGVDSKFFTFVDRLLSKDSLRSSDLANMSVVDYLQSKKLSTEQLNQLTK